MKSGAVLEVGDYVLVGEGQSLCHIADIDRGVIHMTYIDESGVTHRGYFMGSYDAAKNCQHIAKLSRDDLAVELFRRRLCGA